MSNPAHDPLCDWKPCTCPLDYDVPERGHMIGCPEDDCECDLIAKVRADESKRKDNEIYEWRIKASDQYGHGFHEGWKRGHDAATHDVAAES